MSEPVTTLLKRTRDELSAEFRPERPVRVNRAPGRLDVMGGIADYTGSMVCAMPLDRATAVVSQERADRQLQVFSFNLFDEHRPFTLRIPLESLATQPAEALRREFAAPGRTWAAYLVGCLFILHEKGWIDLRDPRVPGLNLAVLGTVPLGAGISSSAAIEVATMLNLIARLPEKAPARGRDDPLLVAGMCQEVENRIVGAPCGIMDPVTSCLGEAGKLLRMICQPHELLAPLPLPEGVRVVGINSAVRHSVAGAAYARTRCAAFMAHAMILETMREIGASAGRELVGDPMHGYLANLDPDDYKRLFRPKLPEFMGGAEFLERNPAGTIDRATRVDPATRYPVRHAADHHVLEARRVRRFAEFIEQAAGHTARQPGAPLDRAGHLMYASHQSYGMDAMLGAPECDLLVELLRARERAGIYGARITGGGGGGTVAVLCDASASADEAIGQVMEEYHRRTGNKPEAFAGTSDGAWVTGTVETFLPPAR